MAVVMVAEWSVNNNDDRPRLERVYLRTYTCAAGRYEGFKAQQQLEDQDRARLLQTAGRSLQVMSRTSLFLTIFSMEQQTAAAALFPF